MSRTLKVAPWLAEHLDSLQTDPEFLAENLVLDVCEQLCVAMEEEGVSQKALAERLGNSPSAVSQLLSGNQNVSLRRLVEVALTLGRGVEPPRLVPLDPVRVEVASDRYYSFSLDIPVEPDRSVGAWAAATGGAGPAFQAAISRHGHEAVPEAFCSGGSDAKSDLRTPVLA